MCAYCIYSAEGMKERLQKTEFESFYCPPPIAAVSAVPFRKVIHEFHSRKRFEEDIMRTLEGRDADKAGIWGTGGVGKTIIAQKILNRALNDGLFDEVVMVTVSQPVDKLAIQKKIAEQIGLTLMGEAFKPRADILRRRLWVRRRLILLDDVWEVLNLEELGIPCNLECCTIILTSRHKDVLKGMGVENACELGVLDEDEAWDFFKKMAGTCVDDTKLKPTTYEVMKECKGLPVALETVGKAHEDEKRLDVWRDSLEQLRKHNPIDIPNVIKEVYRPLKLTYEHLESENAKSTFLLCCLFARDNIPLEHLTYFAFRSRLFNDTWELEGVRSMIRKSIDTLKTCCLLLEGPDADHVRMHGVVRDVSIFIASEEMLVKCNDCTWISSHVDGGARPPMSCFPKLKLLSMNNKDGDQEMEINTGNLTGGSTSTELNVLFIDYGLMKSLPALKISLTTLILRNCKSLESIAVVGQLESLEILVCDSCPLLKELPVQVKRLKHLKLLEISHCFNIERVAAGVISSLVALEELKIMGCFDDWEGWEIDEGKEAMEDASLREIESLKQLRRLNIRVYDIALAAQPLLRLPSKLVQFTVRFGEYFYFDDGLSTSSYQRKMCVDFGREDNINWGDLSTNIFMSRTEYLYAHGVGQVFNLNLASARRIRWLTLEGFGNEKNIISAVAAFPLLDSLFIMFLNKLEEMWDDAPIPSDSFNNLKELRLVGLHGLKRMGKSVLSAANDLFPQLETIAIQECDEIDHLLLLVPDEEEHQHEGNHISTELIFPKLRMFDLYALPKFRSMICSNSSRGTESIQFPMLAEMQIFGCDNLKWFVSRDDEEDDHHYRDAHDSLHMFCNPKVSFGNLEKLTLRGSEKSKNVWCDKVRMDFFSGLVKLEIESHGKIKRLFSSSSKIPQNLVNLQKLAICYCDNMVKVIEDDEEVSSCDHPTILFPSLQEIKLLQLRKLESFCEWSCALELPSLKKLHICYCEEMKSFNAAIGSLVITPTLQAVRIDQYLECVDDLNAALHQHFEKAKGRRRKRRIKKN